MRTANNINGSKRLIETATNGPAATDICSITQMAE